MAEIDSMFILEEAAIIKAIPLSLFDRDDLHFWPHLGWSIYSEIGLSGFDGTGRHRVASYS